MAATNGTILNLLINAPCWVAASLFAFLFPIAKNVGSQFQFSRTASVVCSGVYGLKILNYMVTSNHIHLLVVDDGDRKVIPNSMQLVAGRTGQEFNQRKKRKGAYWEDRYHATAVESGEHLARCMVYIDTNMVRAGVVSHPSMWPFCGHNEIQQPRRKNILIDSEKLQGLIGAESHDQLRTSHEGWVKEYLGEGAKERQDEWTASIAVGGRSFIEKVRPSLAFVRKAEIFWRVTKGINSERVRHRIKVFSGLKETI